MGTSEVKPVAAAWTRGMAPCVQICVSVADTKAPVLQSRRSAEKKNAMWQSHGMRQLYTTRASSGAARRRRRQQPLHRYTQGASEELAGRGLYGQYVLLFPEHGMLEPPLGCSEDDPCSDRYRDLRRIRGCSDPVRLQLGSTTSRPVMSRPVFEPARVRGDAARVPRHRRAGGEGRRADSLLGHGDQGDPAGQSWLGAGPGGRRLHRCLLGGGHVQRSDRPAERAGRLWSVPVAQLLGRARQRAPRDWLVAGDAGHPPVHPSWRAVVLLGRRD